MNKYLVLEIENIEPLKIGSRGVQNHVENSKSYIPGSTIRGALIYSLIHQLKLDKNLWKDGKDTYRKQLLEDIKCYNAYPSYKDKLFFPSPIHLKTNKHEFRKAFANKSENFKGFKASLQENTSYKDTLSLSYISIDDSIIKAAKITKEFRLHHNKSEDKDNLFRYEAIKKGHTFRTIIIGNKEILEEIEESIKNNNRWYLGGSKGAGYGLCHITKTSVCNSYKEAKEKLGLKLQPKEGRGLSITCLSDCIFRDENGNPCNYIPISELESIVGKKNFKLSRRVIGQGYSEGYNTTWGLRYPKESTVKAGSIIKYDCDELSEEELIKIEQRLYGMRTTDGYGWIAVNIEYPSEIDLNIIIANSKLEDKNSQSLYDNINFNDESLQIIIKGLKKAKEKWLRHIFIKEREGKLIKVNKISSSKRKSMLKILKEEIEASDTMLSRSYFNDRNMFSINSNTFKNINDYLKCKENPSLDNYINKKLCTVKGKLFYKDANKKEFLKDLTALALEVGGENYGQDNQV